MRMLLHFTIVLIFFAFGCSHSTQYGIVAPQPRLSVTPPPGPYTEGQSFSVDICVEQEGIKGDFSLSVILVSGQATIALNGTPISPSGEWLPLVGSNVNLSFTPDTAEELLISLQAKSPNGTTSEKYIIRGEVCAASEIKAEAQYISKHINTDVSTLIPIHLMIDKEGYIGEYTIHASISKGNGIIYDEWHHVVTDLPFAGSSDTYITYHPEVLGEHILEFTISTGRSTTTVPIYLDIVKKITVTCPVDNGIVITGTGEYHNEGQTITLHAENDSMYNFEIEGWYDKSTGEKLSTDMSYSITLSRDSRTDYEVKFKRRTVTLTRTGAYKKEVRYVAQENGKPVVKYVYDFRTEFTADYKLSEKIKFYYEEYKYDITTIPPTGRKRNTTVFMNAGATKSEYLWRIDNSYKIYLRKEDNPDFTFYPSYIVSGSTKYIIPSGIIMQ